MGYKKVIEKDYDKFIKIGTFSKDLFAHKSKSGIIG